LNFKEKKGGPGYIRGEVAGAKFTRLGRPGFYHVQEEERENLLTVVFDRQVQEMFKINLK